VSPGAGLIVIPFVDLPGETGDALHDALLQLEGQCDVLLIDQGSTAKMSHGWPTVQAWAESCALGSPHIRLWRHAPPLPSLAATWNVALDFAWNIGHEDCMIWNNDIRVHPDMYRRLRAIAELSGLWFVTPVNCSGDIEERWKLPLPALNGENLAANFGGPDFSCFLIHREAHQRYRFDERFQPAYHEDGDFHRRMWLGGDGNRIAGVTLPYLHYGSRTIHRSEEAYAAFQPQFAACRARYVAKWGGEPHHERKITPDSNEDLDGVGTPGGYLDMEVPHA